MAFLLLLPLSSCNFDVTNPGPVQDEFLNDSDAFPAIVNGMGRNLSDALNFLAFHGSMVVRELTHGWDRAIRHQSPECRRLPGRRRPGSGVEQRSAGPLDRRGRDPPPRGQHRSPVNSYP